MYFRQFAHDLRRETDRNKPGSPGGKNIPRLRPQLPFRTHLVIRTPGSQNHYGNLKRRGEKSGCVRRPEKAHTRRTHFPETRRPHQGPHAGITGPSTPQARPKRGDELRNVRLTQLNTRRTPTSFSRQVPLAQSTITYSILGNAQTVPQHRK